MSEDEMNLRDESGMTLIELMISISLLTVVILPITSSFILGMLESSSAHQRIADSSSAQIVSAYLLSDIQSSKTVTIDPTTPICDTTGDELLELTWVDPNPAVATTHTVSYVSRVVVGETRLVRSTCTNGSVTDDGSLLALNLETFDASCAPDCADAESVLVHVKALAADAPDGGSYEEFEFDIEATRRVAS